MAFIPPESIEAAEAARESEAARNEDLARFDDPNYVAELKSNSPYGEYKPYSAQYEADIAIKAVGFDTPDRATWIEKWETKELNPEGSETLVTEWVKSPFITMFIKEGFLTAEEWHTIQELLIKDSSIEGISSIDESIISEDKKNALIWALWYIDDPANQIKFRENFEADMWNDLGYKEMNDSQVFVFNQIWSHYILPLDGEIDQSIKSIALDTAFEATLNELIDTPIFKKTESYYMLASIIRDGDEDPVKRFEALEQVSNTIEGEHGFKWKKRETATIRSQKQAALKKAGLEKQYEDAQIQLQQATVSKDSKAIRVAQAQIEELEEKSTLGDLWKQWDTKVEVWWIEWSTNEDNSKTA